MPSSLGDVVADHPLALGFQLVQIDYMARKACARRVMTPAFSRDLIKTRKMLAARHRSCAGKGSDHGQSAWIASMSSSDRPK